MKRHSVELEKIKINDFFWSKHVELVKNVIIPYQWEVMNDRIEGVESSHCLENFKIAAKEKEGAFYGAVFQDTDIAKWLEAVGFTLATNQDIELEKTADEVIDLIAKAQCEDGYLNTYFTIKEPQKRWKYLCEGHELYTAGHMMEAAVSYYKGTRKDKFLNCMFRFADLICDTFGMEEGKIHGYPGHQEIEIGLIKLYEVSGERRYLDMAKYFIDARGVGKNYFLQEMKQEGFSHLFPEFRDYDTKYSQSHLPVREQTTAEGHAVRAVYMYAAMADLAYEYQDKGLLDSCVRLWENMTKKRMYVTGSIGSSGILERFTTDYDLPNSYNYSESCASIGLALFGLRMANVTKDASYIDVVERALYNTVLAGIALDGKSFFYVNPLECWPESCIDRTSKEHVKPIRQKWFGVACCPPNIARTLASLGQYIYSIDETDLLLNLFVSNTSQIHWNGEEVDVSVNTKFPFENKVDIAISGGTKESSIGIRIPEYANNFIIRVNGEIINFERKRGYAIVLVNTCEAKLEVDFLAPAKFVCANPLVREDAGKVCIMKGPLVYTLEEVDNGDCLSSILIDTKTKLQEIWKPDLFGGVTIITAPAQKISKNGWDKMTLYQDSHTILETIEIKAIPYCYWNNRGIGEMSVWVKEKF
ncbi:MAG: glycoside hydrolase family 127 protein [Velocimicrobium sp.]